MLMAALVGSIVGALLLGRICRRFVPDRVMISGFGLLPTLALPLFSDLINASPDQAQTFLQRRYPGATARGRIG